MKLLHERVKEAVEAAKKNKVSVLAIAKACGISRQAVYQWMEQGANSIDGANLVELAEPLRLQRQMDRERQGTKDKSPFL